MDFINDLPTSKGKDIIFVVVDILTKYAHFISISSKAKVIQVVDSYVKNIFKLNGFPKVIVSDRDHKFTSNFWNELFHQVGTLLTMSGVIFRGEISPIGYFWVFFKIINSLFGHF